MWSKEMSGLRASRPYLHMTSRFGRDASDVVLSFAFVSFSSFFKGRLDNMRHFKCSCSAKLELKTAIGQQEGQETAFLCDLRIIRRNRPLRMRSGKTGTK